jgi:RNA polymerase sigma-70 factor (ECF subfamily)
MTSSEEEARTIARAVQGDESAQRRLYEAYCAASGRLAFLFLGEIRDAEEVVQDAFVYAFQNLERYDAEKGSFWTWLRVILVSRCRNKRRRRQLPQVSLELLRGVGLFPAAPPTIGSPAHLVESSETRRMIWQMLQQVSPGARDALILRYYEDLSYSEIADALGCSSAAARSRVAHGKVQMRRLLTAGRKEQGVELGTVRAIEATSR